MMRTKTFAAALSISAGLAVMAAAEGLKIESVGREKKYAWIEGGWVQGADCIELKFSSAAKKTSRDVCFRAYFYDKENKLVATMSEPTPIHEYAAERKVVPPQIEPGKSYSVFFGIPPEFQKGDKKWKRVIAVFGSGEEAKAEVFPKDDIRLFDFPEKSKLK